MKQQNAGEPTQIRWRIAGEEFASCNCNWGCPCQFNALPTTISVAVAPSRIETLFAPISFKVDRDKRRATVRIPGIGETNIEPIKNPVTGEEHRARIVLPDGFEYKEAEMGNTAYCRVGAGEQLAFELKNTYGQLNAFDWSN